MPGAPEAILAKFLGTSNLGLDNCNPICFAINKGPLGSEVIKAPIRNKSFIDVEIDPAAPPLIKVSS